MSERESVWVPPWLRSHGVRMVRSPYLSILFLANYSSDELAHAQLFTFAEAIL